MPKAVFARPGRVCSGAAWPSTTLGWAELAVTFLVRMPHEWVDAGRRFKWFVAWARRTDATNDAILHEATQVGANDFAAKAEFLAHLVDPNAWVSHNRLQHHG